MSNSTLFLTMGSGNSFKPALVVRQLGLSVNRQFLDVLAGETRQAPFLAINPRGMVPYLQFADGRGLGESNAIAWYLAEGSPLIPACPRQRAESIQWMIFEQTSLEPNISPARFFTHICPHLTAEHSHEIPGWLARGHQALALLEQHLSAREFMTDHGYGIADIAVFGYTHLAAEGGFDLAAYPAISAWCQRVTRQPGYLPIAELLAV